MAALTPSDRDEPGPGSADSLRPGSGGADAAALDRLLPQTQCRRCGYPSCADYAAAMARGDCLPNRCPPGGEIGLARLARALGVEPGRLDPACGAPRPWYRAVIVEADCIGCTLCIRACPVDAIVGARQCMHTVIEDQCTACELCVAPCPVDCIRLEPVPGSERPGFVDAWMAAHAGPARDRYERRARRGARDDTERAGREGRGRGRLAAIPESIAERRAVLEAAMGHRARGEGAVNPGLREAIFARLEAATPHPTTELEWRNPFELLIAVILSAQATDVSVNRATETLFAAAPTPAAMLELGEAGVREHIKSIGLFNAKAKNVAETCRILVEAHHGEVPRTREALEALPGVGRKTANVVLNTAFGEPTMAVDTHIFRVSNRTRIFFFFFSRRARTCARSRIGCCGECPSAIS